MPTTSGKKIPFLFSLRTLYIISQAALLEKRMPWKSPSEAANPTAMARSKSGAKSIRGQISAPIPIADPIDNGFADRTYTDLSREPTHLSSNTGSADAAVDRPIRVVPTAPAENTSSAVRASRSEAVTKRLSVDGTPQRGSLPPTGKRLSKSQSKPSAAPERKRSPIRNAIGRLFGRKKKTVSQLTEPYEPAQRASAPPPNAVSIGCTCSSLLAFANNVVEQD